MVDHHLVDATLLRQQRDWLLDQPESLETEGLLELLNKILNSFDKDRLAVLYKQLETIDA